VVSQGGASTPAPRVVVADDDVLLREGLASVLERSGFEVVGQAGDGNQLLSLVRSLVPDVAVIDIRMPPTHTSEGLDAAKVLREELPDLGIVVLSAYIDVEHATNLIGAGEGVGYLLKSRVIDLDEFVESLDRIMKGGSVIDPDVVQELVTTRRADDPLASLTEREEEVLALMAEGRSNVGIANRLWVTEGTVEKHVGSILTKLDLYAEEDDHRRVLAVLAFLDSR
jgi:DNA-binding NarL/FixJ family response regulator